MSTEGTTQFGFDPKHSADLVVSAMAGAENERLRQVMESVIRHLHAVVKEVEPTEEEWLTAIKFLTETGHMCTEWRQEFILFSDTFGVSMLVDAINHHKPSGATETTVLGPFHLASSPLDGRAHQQRIRSQPRPADPRAQGFRARRTRRSW